MVFTLVQFKLILFHSEKKLFSFDFQLAMKKEDESEAAKERENRRCSWNVGKKERWHVTRVLLSLKGAPMRARARQCITHADIWFDMVREWERERAKMIAHRAERERVSLARARDRTRDQEHTELAWPAPWRQAHVSHSVVTGGSLPPSSPLIPPSHPSTPRSSSSKVLHSVVSSTCGQYRLEFSLYPPPNTSYPVNVTSSLLK